MKYRHAAFTLIELMIVVAIISVMSAVAIPAFLKYMRRSKTVEARNILRKIYDGEIAYYDIDHLDRQGNVISKAFISAGPEPASVPSGSKTLGNWEDVNWTQLKVSLESPSWYRYQALAAGVSLAASFTARAEGDLDGDQVTSLYERVATINSVTGNLEGSAGLYVQNELE